jgi:hypothetical protein
MRNSWILFLLISFYLSGCKEEEKPDGPYGIYLVQSISTAIPVDFTNSGEQTTEHFDNFSWCGTGEFSLEWRLNKQTSVMDFRTFFFFDGVNEITKEKEIFKGCGLVSRIVSLNQNGDLELSFFGDEGIFSNNPKQIDHNFEVRKLEYFQDGKSIRMVTYQLVYDFFSKEYVKNEMTYQFTYVGPFSN